MHKIPKYQVPWQAIQGAQNAQNSMFDPSS